MIFSNVIVYSVLLLFYAKVTFTRDLTKRTSKNNDDNTQNTFAKLLNSIVRVNEERLIAVKKISELQDYMLTKNRLRAEDDTYDSLEDDENRIYIAFDDPPIRRTVKERSEKVTREACNKLFLHNNNVRQRRRQFVKQACHDQTVDFCTNVCIKSVANVCNNFNCNNKDIRTECHKNCRKLAHEDG